MVTSVEGITEYRLPNGLRVLLFPDPSKPIITVNITYIVGSRMEGYGETGMAHLLEHMVFKGTPKHPHIPDELTAHGASPNGTTSFDRTNYFETFSATDENLNWALSLESDRMINSYIAEKDLKSEFTVVRNEFESGENNPAGVLMERVLSTAYLWHNYGKSTIGSKEDIELVPIKNLQAFYKKYYQPDNAVLMVTGKIDEAKVLALVTKYFGPIPRPSRKLEATYTVEPPQDGERMVELNRVGDVQSVSCAFHTVSGADPLYPAFDILNVVLTDEPTGRLYQALVKTEKASTVWADNPTTKDPGYFYINADVLKDKDASKAKETLLKTLEELKTKPVTQEELDRAKTKLLKQIDQVYRNSKYVGLTMSEYIAQGDWRLAFLYRDNLKKTTLADVNKVANEYFVSTNRTMGQFVPTDKPVRVTVPQQPDVTTLVKDYKGNKAMEQGEEFDPSPANIEKRTQRGTLPGGAKYALLSKTTRGNTVEARITLHIGDEKSLEGKAVIATLTARMLARGTKSSTMAQINEALDKLSSSVNIYGNDQNVNVIVRSTKPNLAQALDIVQGMLREPAFNEEEFKTLKNETISQLEEERSDPQGLAFREFSRLNTPKPKGHILYAMSVEEEVAATQAASLKDVKKFYADFYGASTATAALVGDFDASTATSQLTKILGNWAAPTPYVRVPAPFDDLIAQNKEINTPDKKNATMVAGMNIKIRDDNPDYAALKMGDFIFGGGFLNSRLATRIRQKEGLSYGVGSFVQVSPFDESGAFISYAIYNPENKTKLEKVWMEELEKMLQDGFTEDELKQAKAGYLQYRTTGRAEDGQLVGTLNNYLHLNRTMQWDMTFDESLKKLTVAQLNATMKKYISASRVISVKAGDFKKQ